MVTKFLREIVEKDKTGKTITIYHHPDYDKYKVPNGAGGSFHNDKEDAEGTARIIHGKNIIIKHRSKRYET